jgi:hypothetical protein
MNNANSFTRIGAAQTMAVTATTGVLSLTSVGSHYSANVQIWNSGPNGAIMSFGASAGITQATAGGFFVPASSFCTLERPPGPQWLTAICSGTKTAGLHIATGLGNAFQSK